MLYQPCCRSQWGLHLSQTPPKRLNGIRLFIFFPNVFILLIKNKPKACVVNLQYFPEQIRACKLWSEILAMQKAASAQGLQWVWIGMQRGGFVASQTITRFCSRVALQSPEKVGMAPRTGSDLDQQTALAFPQSEPRQAGLTPSILHLTNSRRD